jgi:hypothetical protein
MRHIRTLTTSRVQKASSLDDKLNSIWNRWLEFVFEKKNAVP